ncbi:MAG: hypothetical protein WCI57_04405 [Candidatus Berkelbacteria bacterium]
MPDTEKNIAKGQYWVDKHNRIVVICTDNATLTDSWGIRFVSENGTCDQNFCSDADLVCEISKDQARALAISHATKQIERTLLLE